METSPTYVKPSARKTHRKTRTGCRTCKSRKIKCDEQRPSCHNCIKHSVQCDFLVTAAASAAGISQTDTPVHHSPANSHGTPQYDRNGDGSSLSGEPSVHALNLTDLELLHNYTTSTAFSLHTDPAMKILWRVNVPQVGFQNDFVMRGILALSALHLARFRPEKRNFYMAQALVQHQTGLRMTTGLLPTITKENCNAIYLFSALTLFFTLASPRKPGDFLLVGENGIADWLYLVRGTNFIIQSSEEFLFRGPLGPMFIAGKRRSDLKLRILAESSPQDDPLHDLSNLITETCPVPANIPVYLSAINTLRSAFVFHNKQAPPGHESGDIFYWVFRIPEEFLELLRQYAQESLTIFAYFCVVLKRLDAHWWMEGWSTHLMSRIWNLLDEEHRYVDIILLRAGSTDEMHRLWIRWPIEEIGWIPN